MGLACKATATVLQCSLHTGAPARNAEPFPECRSKRSQRQPDDCLPDDPQLVAIGLAAANPLAAFTIFELRFRHACTQLCRHPGIREFPCIPDGLIRHPALHWFPRLAGPANLHEKGGSRRCRPNSSKFSRYSFMVAYAPRTRATPSPMVAANSPVIAAG